MNTRTQYLARLSESLERLERVYIYINNTTDGLARFEALRLCILAETEVRASMAGSINGRISLPHHSWRISRSDLDPRVSIYVEVGLTS